MYDRLRRVLLGCLALLCSLTLTPVRTTGQTVIFSDDFNRSDGFSVGNGWQSEVVHMSSPLPQGRSGTIEIRGDRLLMGELRGNNHRLIGWVQRTGPTIAQLTDAEYDFVVQYGGTNACSPSPPAHREFGLSFFKESDADNGFSVIMDPGGTIRVMTFGGLNEIAEGSHSVPCQTGTDIRVKVKLDPVLLSPVPTCNSPLCHGIRIRVKLWLASGPEPAGWHLSYNTGHNTDGGLEVGRPGSYVGFWVKAEAGWGADIHFYFDDFTITSFP